jgi:hypothetical protein
MQPQSLLSRPALLLLGLLSLAACGAGTGGGSSFIVRTTSQANSGTTPVTVTGAWLVFLANEAMNGAGTDLNADGDTLDEVAVAVRLNSAVENVIGVAALAAAVVGDEIYLDVEEADDGVDWNGDLDTADRVLVHWTVATGVATFVDTLDSDGSGERFVALAERLIYASDLDLLAGDGTSLFRLEVAAPTTPVAVENTLGAGTLHPMLLGADAGLVFLQLDESEEGGADLNLDTDGTDEVVLALLDGTDAAARVVSTGLAMADDDQPIDAFSSAPAGDWLVAFLVNEAEQGATNLNDQALFANFLLPDTCIGTPDIDAFDDVLHYANYLALAAGTEAPVNTGLAGGERVLAVDGFVATLAPELDSNCDLNEDGDAADQIARWVEAIIPIAPPRDPANLHAVESSIPGGAQGLTSLDDRLVAVLSEDEDGRDLDGNALDDFDLVAWLDPTDGATAAWTVMHPTGNPGTGVGKAYVGASWLAEAEEEDRIGIGFQEEVVDLNLNNNLNCVATAKDGDKSDSLPVWADFEGGGASIMDFDGLGYSVVSSNAGIVLASGFAFFRVDEAADGLDYNNDASADDVVLFRNPQLSCAPVPMATSSALTGPVIVSDGEQGAAFVSSELGAGLDFNGDGDTNDLVVRYFTF